MGVVGVRGGRAGTSIASAAMTAAVVGMRPPSASRLCPTTTRHRRLGGRARRSPGPLGHCTGLPPQGPCQRRNVSASHREAAPTRAFQAGLHPLTQRPSMMPPEASSLRGGLKKPPFQPPSKHRPNRCAVRAATPPMRAKMQWLCHRSPATAAVKTRHCGCPSSQPGDTPQASQPR